MVNPLMEQPIRLPFLSIKPMRADKMDLSQQHPQVYKVAQLRREILFVNSKPDRLVLTRNMNAHLISVLWCYALKNPVGVYYL